MQELAKKANLSLSYVSEIERGTKRPSSKTVDKLAAALEVPKTQFINWDDVSDTSLSVGDKIHLLRVEKDLPLTELARRVGITVTYLSDIERGTAVPALNSLKRIADELAVPVSFLMGQAGTLGYKLKALREEYGLTQMQLADRAGVTAGLIGQIEHGKVQPSLKTLDKLAQVMGVSPCYFIMEPGAVDELLSLMTPELREQLLHPNVQAILNLVCNLNEKEFQFILNFIQLYKRSGLTID